MQKNPEPVKHRKWYLAALLLTLFAVPILLPEQLVKSSWLFILLFGVLSIGVNSLLIYAWFTSIKLFRIHFIGYSIFFILLLVLYSKVLYLFFDRHTVGTAMNYLIRFLGSPLPAMIYIPFCKLLLYKRQ